VQHPAGGVLRGYLGARGEGGRGVNYLPIEKELGLWVFETIL
jgi:hypothetical protein